ACRRTLGDLCAFVVNFLQPQVLRDAEGLWRSAGERAAHQLAEVEEADRLSVIAVVQDDQALEATSHPPDRVGYFCGIADDVALPCAAEDLAQVDAVRIVRKDVDDVARDLHLGVWSAETRAGVTRRDVADELVVLCRQDYVQEISFAPKRGEQLLEENGVEL